MIVKDGLLVEVLVLEGLSVNDEFRDDTSSVMDSLLKEASLMRVSTKLPEFI